MDMIKEVIERYEDEFKAIEYFTFNAGMRWHTDTLTRLTDEEEAGLTHNECVDDYALMTLEDYNETILANCAKAEDLGLDESDFPILCIAVDKDDVYGDYDMYFIVDEGVTDRFEDYVGEDEEEAIRLAKEEWFERNDVFARNRRVSFCVAKMKHSAYLKADRLFDWEYAEVVKSFK